MTVVSQILQICWGILYSAFPSCTFKLACITSLVELTACVALAFFCVSAILDCE